MAKTKAIAVLCALLLLVAGCGGGNSKPLKGAAYVDRVNAIASGLNTIASNLSSEVDSPESAATALTGAQAALRKAGRQLAAITPPPAIKGPHERLVKAVDELAAELTPVIAKVQTGQLDSLGQALSLKGVTDARAAIAEITKAGYKIQIPLLS